MTRVTFPIPLHVKVRPRLINSPARLINHSWWTGTAFHLWLMSFSQGFYLRMKGLPIIFTIKKFQKIFPQKEHVSNGVEKGSIKKHTFIIYWIFHNRGEGGGLPHFQGLNGLKIWMVYARNSASLLLPISLDYIQKCQYGKKKVSELNICE